jgi:hypothetical protein
MTARSTAGFWSRYLTAYREAADDLGARLYYVRGFTDAANIPFPAKIPAYYMEIYYGANDGLIPLAHQRLAGHGVVLTTLRVDHTLVIAGGPRTAEAIGLRRGLTAAIFLGAGL